MHKNIHMLFVSFSRTDSLLSVSSISVLLILEKYFIKYVTGLETFESFFY